MQRRTFWLSESMLELVPQAIVEAQKRECKATLAAVCHKRDVSSDSARCRQTIDGTMVKNEKVNKVWSYFPLSSTSLLQWAGGQS